jgi:hypothetical protein
MPTVFREPSNFPITLPITGQFLGLPHPRPVQPLWQQVESPFAKRIAPSACRSIAPSRFCIRPNRSRVRQRPCCGNNRVKRSELFIEISITSLDN